MEVLRLAITVEKAIKLMADAAEKGGADANDSTGLVRAIVTAHGLSFNAWFCVCCELADRKKAAVNHGN